MSLESYSKIIKPKKIVASQNGNIAKVAIEPLQKGFGTTLGNSLRRVLLSSIRGSVFSSVQITGVKHSLVRDVKILSKPSARVYYTVEKMRHINMRNPFSLVIMSTSFGVMTIVEALNRGIGGEAICTIF